MKSVFFYILISFWLLPKVNAQQVLGDFNNQDIQEWPKVIWYRDTGNNWDEGLIKTNSAISPYNRTGFGIHMNESRQFGFWSTGWNPLFLVEGGSGNAYLRGNLAMGIENPLGRFHVDGPLDGSLSTIRIGKSVPGNLNVPIGSTTGGYNIDFHTWRDVRQDLIGARIRAERINNYQPNNALVQSMDLAFYTSDGLEHSNLTEKLRIKSGGDVGIGTSDPKGYKLAVAGSMIAESIKVKTLSTWPDYVFHSEYVLPSLTDIKRFVQQNKHLPGIPSAPDVADNGIDVGEMNAKLLRKIEELTLYLIDQNERLDKQQKEIDLLKNRK